MSNESENEKTKLSYEDRCFKWAANFYLCEELPDAFFEMNEASQDYHLECHANVYFSIIRGYTIRGYIETLAEEIIEKTYPAS
tara:strand:+ start:10 stop:258 length:249 start_codon:yes stop_codon:yes gene_type:complete